MDSVVDYIVSLVVERWIEMLVLAIMISLWRWFMGYTLRTKLNAQHNRLTALETELKEMEEGRGIVLKGTAFTLIQGDQHNHYRLPKDSEIIIPKSVLASATAVSGASTVSAGARILPPADDHSPSGET